MPSLLANGKLGDVFANDMILKYIKTDETLEDYSWITRGIIMKFFMPTKVYHENDVIMKHASEIAALGKKALFSHHQENHFS